MYRGVAPDWTAYMVRRALSIDTYFDCNHKMRSFKKIITSKLKTPVNSTPCNFHIHSNVTRFHAPRDYVSSPSCRSFNQRCNHHLAHRISITSHRISSPHTHRPIKTWVLFKANSYDFRFPRFTSRTAVWLCWLFWK